MGILIFEMYINKRIDTGVVYDSQPKPVRKTLFADFLPSEAQECKLVDESAEQSRQKIKNSSFSYYGARLQINNSCIDSLFQYLTKIKIPSL